LILFALYSHFVELNLPFLFFGSSYVYIISFLAIYSSFSITIALPCMNMSFFSFAYHIFESLGFVPSHQLNILF